MMDKEENKPNDSRFRILNKIKLSDTLILAALPVAAYLLIFIYYSGYFSVFKLPIQFIEFDLISIFLVSGILLGLAAVIYYWGDLIFSLFKIFPTPIERRLTRISISMILFIMFWYLYNETIIFGKDWLIVSSVILLYVLLEFGSPWRLLTNRKTYLEELEAQDKRKALLLEKQANSQEYETSIDRLMRIAPEVFLFVFIIIIVNAAGRYEAFQKTEFQIVNTKPERIVLWSTNDYVICAPFNRQTNEIEQSYIVLMIGEDPSIEYHFENLGRMRLKGQLPTPTNTKHPSPTLSAITYTSTLSFTRTPTLTKAATPTLTLSQLATPSKKFIPTVP